MKMQILCTKISKQKWKVFGFFYEAEFSMTVLFSPTFFCSIMVFT